MSSIKKIVDNLLAMQESLFSRLNPNNTAFIDKEREEGKGRIATLVLLDEDSEERINLTMDSNTGFVRYAMENETPIHTIETSLDTFIDILSADSTFQREFSRGHIVFSGKNWFYHAQKWNRALKRLGSLLNYVKKC